MNKSRRLMILGMIPAMFACGGSGESEDNNETDKVVAEDNCTYSYDESSTVITWTAFKTSDKLAVEGSFDELTVTTQESNDIYGVFTGATFEIPVSSLNSQDPVRDHKLKNSFFGNMNETVKIAGNIVSMDNSDAAVAITMNGKTVEYGATVTTEAETVTIEMVLDIMDFEASIAMDSLSIVCAEKHTGEDGNNKLWSDVAIAAKTTLKKDCPQ